MAREHDQADDAPPAARYFSIATSPIRKEPRSAVGSGSGDLLGPHRRIEQLLGDDQAAHGDQDLLQVLAVDRLHDHRARRQGRARRVTAIAASDAGSDGGQVEPERIGLHPGAERQQHQRRDDRRRPR